MHKLPYMGGVLALLASLPFTALADNTANLGGIAVTATRTPLIADQEVAPVIVIGPEQLKLAQGQDVGAVLHQYAGLDIAQSGPSGQPESLFLRGTNSTHTLVMIDGVRINPDNGFGSALQNIRLSDIERIEIVKGPRASLYGSDAIGGVINIITRKAGQGIHYGVHLGVGRYGTYDDGGHFAYGEDDSGLGVTADDYHTDGFPAVAGTSFDSGNTDRSWNLDGHTKLSGMDVALKHWQSAGYTQYTSFDFNPPFGLMPFDEDYRDQTTSLSFDGKPVSDWHSNLNLSHMHDAVDQRQSDPFNFPPAPDFVRTQRNAVDWQNDVPFGDVQLFTAGAYYEAEHTSTLSFGTPYDETHRVNALYLEDDLDLGVHRLVLAGRSTHDQEFGNHFTWNADYGYDLDPATRFTAGAGSAFRAPTAAERFGFDGNPDLKPETSENLELGARHKFGDTQRLGVSLFRNNLDDLIVFQPTGPFTGTLENVGKARVRGMEFSHELAMDAWDWRSDLIFQDPRDLNTGATLLRRAKRTLTTNLAWHDDRTRASLNILFTGPRPDGDFNTGAPVTDAGYVLTSVSLHRDLGAGFGMLLRLDNLFDVRYSTENGFNTAGRSLFLNLEYASQ